MVAEYQVGQFLWSVLWFTIFFIWIYLLIRVFMDIFRSHDMGGVAKTLWVIFVIFLPYLGVFVYVIARGSGMHERDVAAMQARDAAMRSYIRDATASSGSAADELGRLADLKERGVIDEAEFQRMKASIVGS